MAERKREEATCSFHYLTYEQRETGKASQTIPFSDEQFEGFCSKLLAQKDVDLTDGDTVKRIKTSIDAPVEKCERIDERTIFGRFRKLYSGHAYENTDVGEVPFTSVSLRPFFFLAYLSESGRIYVGSQYLGQFGGYGDLFRTLRRFLPEPVVSHSFRHDASSYKDPKPKLVRVSYSRKPTEITGSPKFGERGAMVFKQASSKDEEFRTTVRTKILARLGQSDAKLKKAIAEMVSGNELLALRDEDIEDCTVIATVNGKDRAINVIEAGHFATRFSLDIAEYVKGHPNRNQSKAAMIKLLKNQIISRKERV